MRVSSIVAAISLILSGCMTVPNAEVDQSAFRDVTWNGTKPTYSNEIYTFELAPGKCGKKLYGDGRGESDCNGGRVRSQIRTKKLAKVGETKEYSFDFFVPKDFDYNGDRSYPAYSRLLISEWKRDEGIKNHIYEILLESVRGVTFEREVCIEPAEFGKWNRFSLRIKWSTGDDGYLEAYCNDRLVLQRRNTQTVIPPDCGAFYKLHCVPELQQPEADIIWAIGPNFSGYGSDYKKWGKPNPFAPWPPNGVRLQVRNIYYGPPT